MRFMAMNRTCLLAAALLYSAMPAAEVYKWVDANGKAHFGDKAPDEKKAQAIGDQLARTNIDHTGSSMPATLPDSNKKTVDEMNLELAEKLRLKKAIGPYCAELKKDIASIARGDRGTFYDKNGKAELVLEKDRGKKLEEFKAQYRSVGCEKLD